MKTLDRYLYREMLGPFLVALLGFVVLLVGHMLYTAIRMILKFHVPGIMVLRFVLLQVPPAAVMAFPVSTMLAAALTFNRMLRDNEVPILRLGGISLWRLLQPVAVAGLVVTGLSFTLDEYVCPWAADASRELVVQTSLCRPQSALRPGQLIDIGRNFRVIATTVDRETGALRDVLVYWIRNREDPIVFWAKEAEVTDSGWWLRDVQVFAMARHPGPIGGQTPSAWINLSSIVPGGWAPPPGTSEMSLRELGRRIAEQRRAGGRPRTFELSYHRKFAAPFACLIFALFAGPVTLRFAHGGSLAGVLLTFVTVLVYFIMMLWFQALGQQGIITPLVAAWGPNGLFGLLALALTVVQR